MDGNATTARGSQDAALSAAESDGARLGRLRAVLPDEAAAARYREVLDDGPVRFDTAALDGALAAGERERERAAARRAADLETATSAAARSDVKLHPAGVRAIYETGETHAAGLAAVERTTEALDAAADQRLPTSTIIGAWNANRSEPGGIASALSAATAAATAARLEEERAAAEAARRKRQAAIEERNSRVEKVLSDPASAEAFIAALGVEDPLWRTGTRPACIDRALDEAELGVGRREVAAWQHREHQVVLEAEQQQRGVPSAAWRDTVDCFKGQTAAARHGRSVSWQLSDRACVRALAAEKAEPAAPRNLVQRLYDWLRTRIERLFGRLSDPAAATTRGPAASAERRAEAARPPPTAFEERYCREWPEHAADIRRPDFEKLAAGASGRNRLFEREEPWTTVEPGELPAALAKPSPAWSDKAVEEVTRRTTIGGWAPDRTEHRRVTEAHLSDYGNRLPAEYSHSAEWRRPRGRGRGGEPRVVCGRGRDRQPLATRRILRRRASPERMTLDTLRRVAAAGGGMSGRNGRMARAVALSARDVRRVGLTAHASRAVAVERRVLPAAAVATLDNGVLRRVSRSPGKSLPHGEAGPSLGQPAPAPAAPELPPEADRLAVPEAALEGAAADVWRDVIAAVDGDTLKRGKVRKQIGRTLRGAGLYLFVAAGMHAAGTAKKAKGRAAARRKTVEEAGRARCSVAAHYPDCLSAFDAALRHALANPAPLPPKGGGDAT